MSEFLGKLVQDGEIKFWSASALERGNPDAFGGCERKFYYQYVEGIKEPERKGREAGTKAHAEIEHYLKTGEDVLGTVARRIRKFMPERGPNLYPEHEIPGGALTLEGRRVVGKADLINARGQWINPRAELDGDPKGTIEIIDWKFVSDMSYAKNGWELLTTPMVTYGRYVLDRWEADWVRVSHVYGHLSKGEPAAKTTLLARRIDIDRRWEQTGAVARSLIDVARSKNATEVTPNLRACDEYGGCAYYATCPRTRDQRLQNIFQGTPDMSLLANLTLPPSAPAQVAPAAPTDPAAAAAFLLAQERQTVIAGLPPDIRQNWACVKSAGMGLPPLGGMIARAVSLIEGFDLRGDGLAGAGALANIATVADRDTLAKLAGELAAHVPAVDPKPYLPPVLPPDAPVSNPGVQSTYTMQPAASVATPPPTITVQSLGGGKTGGDAPAPSGIGTSPVVGEAPKRGRGRPRKAPGDAPAPSLEQAVTALSKAIVDVIMAALAQGDGD